ncbi:hypothetical protein, partial [Paraburkholderia sp.]|uniref:hypothetical protein n=1 Tax=Paraburkholderia sp. TaxID=1926495 RepID=UPI002AFF9FF9
MTDNDDSHERGFLDVLGWNRCGLSCGLVATQLRASCGFAAARLLRESDSGNKNGVPRTQSMTESGGRRCPDLYCSGRFVVALATDP